MQTYAFLRDGDVEPADVQRVLEEAGLSGVGVQVLHYTQPRVVLVIVDRELSRTEREEVARAIAASAGVAETLGMG